MMMRFTTTLLAVAALSGSVSAADTRQGVCLNLIEQHCSGQSSPSVMKSCVDSGVLTCSLPSHCLQPKETGMCRAAFPRFYYNPATGSCEDFIYGGCGGNTNNFETKSECHEACAGLRFCGGNTGETCPDNYHCAERPGEVGQCVLIPEEKRAAARNGGHHGKTMKKQHPPPKTKKDKKVLRHQKIP